MKKTVFAAILVAFAFSGLSAAPNDNNAPTKAPAPAPANKPDMSEIDKKFSDLGKRRVGLTAEQVTSLKDPFYEEEVKIDVTPADQTGLKLTAVIGEKVKINSSWYSVGDTVGSLYTVVSVKPRSVVLSTDNGEIELNLTQGMRNVFITNE